MSVSIQKNSMPTIGHLQFLILRSFGSETTIDAPKIRAKYFSDIEPAAFTQALRRMVSKGHLSRIQRGKYKILPDGLTAMRELKEFYKPLVA